MRDEIIRWIVTALMLGMVALGLWAVMENADRRAKGEPGLYEDVGE